MTRAYEEIIEFIAAGSTPGTVTSYRPSDETRDRVGDLIHRAKTAELSPDDRSELDHYLELEHIMRLAKARAHMYVSQG